MESSKDADVHTLAEAELGTVSLSSVLGLHFWVEIKK